MKKTKEKQNKGVILLSPLTPMERKYCKNCFKMMLKIEYPKHFRTRKYCSTNCATEGLLMIQAKWRILGGKEVFQTTEHNRKLLELNKKIQGEFGDRHPAIPNSHIPDIINDESEYELEMCGWDKRSKFLKKWQKPRYDGKTPKKRILIVDVPENLKELFDEVYFFDNFVEEEKG